MTALEVTPREARESASSSSEDCVAILIPASVSKALPVVIARLRGRHPGVPAEIVEHQVNVATARLTREARIHDYLLILIERSASASLKRY